MIVSLRGGQVILNGPFGPSFVNISARFRPQRLIFATDNYLQNGEGSITVRVLESTNLL